MPNVTLSIPEELRTRMKKHSEIRWSEVVRRSISNKIEDLDMMERLTSKSRLTKTDVDDIASKIDANLARKLGLR